MPSFAPRARPVANRSPMRWLVVTGILLGLALATAFGLRWYRSPTILTIALTPASDRSQPFIQALVNSRLNFRFALVRFDDNAKAFAALRNGTVQFVVARVDQETTGDIRAVAVLSTRYLIQSEAAAPADEDLAFAGRELTRVLNRPVSVSGLDVRAARRFETEPKALATRRSLKLTDDQADRIWYLGAARDEPEEADDWRGKALTVSRMLVTTERLDRQLVHDVAMQITDVIRSTRAEIPAAREVSLAPIDEAKGILRAHDGIARFINREGQAFFERYGDLVYVGISVFGLLLTAMGALAAWIRYRIADNGRRYLTRMQMLVHRAARRPQDADRIRIVATRLSLRFAEEVAARRIAHDVLSAYEVLQKTLDTWLARQASP